ncbi:OB-fold domain-containing protein [Candidatus Peregrinibacteria bacterium]|nr:OB-fold domain-containing protein [Candidatus Peregrinibacteria bacterium]
MRDSSPIIHRAQKKRSDKLQSGTIVSFTMLRNPPSQFGKSPRPIGLIELEDGSNVLATLVGSNFQIGQTVRPRMRLSYVNEEKLRIYEVAYETVMPARISYPREKAFPGYILALTGPSGVGKTTVSRILAKGFGGSLTSVPIVTTRAPKSGDEGEYLHMTTKEFENMRAKGAIIAVTHIPSATEERWYGYRAADIEAIWKAGKLPVVITEMHLLQGLATHFGRRSILSFGLLPPGKSKRTMLSHLLHRLRTRGRDTEEHIKDRLKNAEADIAFFKERKDLFDHLLVNEDLEKVISTLKERVPGLSEA